MKHSYIVVAALAVAVFASGCGGESKPDREAGATYLKAVEQLFLGAAHDRLTIEAQGGGETPVTTPSDDERVSRARTRLRELTSLARETRSDLDDLDPPSELTTAHKKLLDALEDFADGWQEFIDSDEFAEYVLTLAQGDTPAQFQELNRRLGLEDLAVLSARIDEACAELQEFADAHAVEVRLCDDE